MLILAFLWAGSSLSAFGLGLLGTDRSPIRRASFRASKLQALLGIRFPPGDWTTLFTCLVPYR